MTSASSITRSDPESFTGESELTEEETKKIESQLKKLGYIEKTDSVSNN